MSAACRSSFRLTRSIKSLVVSVSVLNESVKDSIRWLMSMLAPFACAGVVAATVSRLWAGTRFMGVA